MTRDREHNESLAMPHNVAMSSARQQATAAETGWTDEAERAKRGGQRGRQGRTVTARLPPLALIKPRRHNKLQLPGIVTALSAWPACSACPESRAWPKTYPSQSTRRWQGAAEGQNEGGTKDVGPAVKIGS